MAKLDLTLSTCTFEDLINERFLYVDKTEYLWNLIQSGDAMYFLARPRRFGKSLTVSTLKAIFQGKKELFKGLAIYDKPYDWKNYPVIHIDMNGRNLNGADAVKHSLINILAEQAQILGIQLDMDEPTTMFHKLIRKLSATSPVVVLVDEYDKPILNNITKSFAADILETLKAFYSVIKAKSDVIRFTFVTGVSKFSLATEFGGLNNLQDISMDAKYATMLGYTQQNSKRTSTNGFPAPSQGKNCRTKSSLPKSSRGTTDTGSRRMRKASTIPFPWRISL